MLNKYPTHAIEIINRDKPLTKTEQKIIKELKIKNKNKKESLQLVPIRDGKKTQCFLLRKLSNCEPRYIAFEP
jgi:uncharacterized protein (DUF2344 family)